MDYIILNKNIIINKNILSNIYKIWKWKNIIKNIEYKLIKEVISIIKGFYNQIYIKKSDKYFLDGKILIIKKNITNKKFIYIFI